MRELESVVAGHSDAVFLSFYNTRAAQASHMLISALQVLFMIQFIRSDIIDSVLSRGL